MALIGWSCHYFPRNVGLASPAFVDISGGIKVTVLAPLMGGAMPTGTLSTGGAAERSAASRTPSLSLAVSLFNEDFNEHFTFNPTC